MSTDLKLLRTYDVPLCQQAASEIERLRAEVEALRKLLLECAAFMGEFSEDSCAESAALRQACELAQHDMTEKP